jgi:hypothetical protein
MARASSRKSLTALISLTALGAITLATLGASAIALATTGAMAMALNNAVRVSPAMNHVDALGGRLDPHTDRVFGPGGGNSQSFAECYRRNHLRLEKVDTSKSDGSISDKARRMCGI